MVKIIRYNYKIISISYGGFRSTRSSIIRKCGVAIFGKAIIELSVFTRKDRNRTSLYSVNSFNLICVHDKNLGFSMHLGTVIAVVAK